MLHHENCMFSQFQRRPLLSIECSPYRDIMSMSTEKSDKIATTTYTTLVSVSICVWAGLEEKQTGFLRHPRPFFPQVFMLQVRQPGRSANKLRHSGEPLSEPAAAAVCGLKPPAVIAPSQRSPITTSTSGVDFGRTRSSGASVQLCACSHSYQQYFLCQLPPKSNQVWVRTKNTHAHARTKTQLGRLHSALQQDKQEQETKLEQDME